MGEQASAPIAVIGIGNSLRRDDGVGHAVIEALRFDARARGEVQVDLVVADGESTRLLETWRGREFVVMVDAALGSGQPGTVSVLDLLAEKLPTGQAPASSHASGLADALALARALDLVPARLVAYTVEAEDLSHGEGLSPAVAAAVEPLAARILGDLALGRATPSPSAQE